MITYTIKCQLLASECDSLNYCTLVFKNLENNCPFGHNYCMITVFPNWQSRIPDVGEVGYLQYDEVEAGIDKWYCQETKEQIPYNYSNLIFKKFVKEVDNLKSTIIL